MNRLIYFGPPGTGKTTTLLERLEEQLKAGVDPERVAFLTFTRRARQEALERVEKTLSIAAKDLPHFRTIHSMAYRGLKLKEGDVMGYKELDVFGKAMGLTFGRKTVSELAAEGIVVQNEGDALMAIDTLARLRGVTIKQAWNTANTGIAWPLMDFFSSSYAKYKHDTGLMDFTDVLSEFARRKIQLPVDVAFIDEAQDLSALQWLAALQAVTSAKTQFVAGDDDQAIYRWAGADVDTFLNLPGDRVILNHSYRLPVIIHAVAQRIAKRIKTRVDKTFSAREAEGLIKVHGDERSIKIEKGQQWLWLVRNRFMLMRLHGRLIEQNMVFSEHGASSIVESHRDAIYTWERLRAGKSVGVPSVRDLYKLLRSGTQIARGHKLLPKVAEDATLTLAQLRESHGLLADGTWFEVLLSIPMEKRAYYRALLRKHRTLKLEPQVQLETIHGAKGAQADYVALFTEQSRRTAMEGESAAGADDEHRVWYVGVTRARCELHVVLPSGPYAYVLPSLRSNSLVGSTSTSVSP